MYPTLEGFAASTAAAKVNGYLAVIVMAWNSGVPEEMDRCSVKPKRRTRTKPAS